jgi:NADPH:quinone reductase-like Zn-dependent oxidoreductase
MALLQGGGYAEYAVAYESSTLHAPPSLDMQTLTSIPEQWMTAYQLLFAVGHLQAGETVLLHAAASGVGQAAIQLATRAGATCFATCRSDEKTACCLEMGARAAFNVAQGPVFADLVRSQNSGKLADLILDPIGGGPSANENMDALAVDGRWVFYGTMGGKGIADETLASKILGKRASLIGSTLRSRPQEYKSKLAQALEREVVPAIASGELKVLIDSVYPMTTEGVQQAHLRMGANENIGKIVLTVREEE